MTEGGGRCGGGVENWREGDGRSERDANIQVRNLENCVATVKVA